MPKEMIISVNGREKKIAIIENGLVSEFYIERGEGEQGIVGNIYKGRVMRVLPGMQSAFVDIGLDRDAFLYVSDFFDEEEEFERIVVEPKEQSAKVAPPAPRASDAARREPATERLPAQSSFASTTIGTDARDARGEAREAIRDEEDTTASAAAELLPAFDEDQDDFAPDTSEATRQITATDTESEDDRDARIGRRRRRRRGGSGRTGDDVAAGGEGDASASGEVRATQDARRSSSNERPRQTPSLEEIRTPFVVSEDSFQRIIDEDERQNFAQTNGGGDDDGEMLKDAMLQERLTDQVRRVEFDMEATAATEVGSLLGSASGATASSFERIEDADDGATSEARGANAAETSTPVVARLLETVPDDVAPNQPTQRSFERVSDDEASETAVGGATAPPTVTTSDADTSLDVAAANETATTKRGRSRRGSGKKDTRGDAPEPAAAMTTTPTRAVADEATTGTPSTRKGRAAASGRGAAKGAGKKAADDNEPIEATRSRRPRQASRVDADATQPSNQDTPEEADASSARNTDSSQDADASVRASTSRGEFASRRRRRGGSGGSGGNRRPPRAQGEEGGSDEPLGTGNDIDDLPENGGVVIDDTDNVVTAADRSNADTDADAAAPLGVEEVAPITLAPTSSVVPTATRPQQQQSGGGRGAQTSGRSNSGNTNRDGREGRDGKDGRDTREGRDGGREGRDGRDRRPPMPTITDLLREGQEIIVQIAKEPISQKGARITSHIALPGRFLVYMPTVEHVGVSRKIESDSERQRLRKLITAIRKEEDVPSGGFIVRTAGTGITDEDLREDARYLVRTWRDIRRSAERVKAPALAHQDLDLVQRLLRDQLSEEFTAIRVDNETEYLATVEFINRIQPRLVNRVKLYTRDEPIMETFGVQAEIDKAIKPRVWLRSGGYLVINQTEALVAIDVNTGKFVGRGGSRLEDTITKTNLEAVDEIARQIRLRDLGGIIVLDLIDMEERRNRARVMQALQEALEQDKSPTKVLSFNDFGLVIMTRKRVKQSLERTLCAPCPYCQGAGLVKSPQTIAYEVLDEARRLANGMDGDRIKQTTLRIHPEVAKALRTTEKDVLTEIEDYLGAVDITSDDHVHQEQFDFAFV